MGKIIIVVAVIFLAGGIFFFFGNGKSDQKAEAPTFPEMKATAVGGEKLTPSPSGIDTVPLASVPETKEVTVEANNWYFEPEEIRVKEGTKVRIILRGISGAHIFAIPDFSVKSQLVEPGETATVEFVADKKGEFSFKCALFCGEGHSGMTGRLIVE
ncbi:MAG: cupredoxin domain-containing protein [Patescibacteria group bacterium]